MEKIIVDASGASFGRLCSFVAKKAIGGDEIEVVNCELAIMTGNKKDIIAKYKSLNDKGGHSLRGPRISRVSYKIVKRGIRGMVPNHREGLGRDAFKRVKCHDNVPEELKDKEMLKMGNKIYNKTIELKELVTKI